MKIALNFIGTNTKIQNSIFFLQELQKKIKIRN